MGTRSVQTDVSSRMAGRRLTTAATSLAALFIIGLAPAGCVRGAGTQAPPVVSSSAPSEQVPALEALATAATTNENQSFNFTMFAESTGIRYTGSRDSNGNSSTDILGQTRILVVGVSAYVRLSAGLVAQSSDPTLRALADTWVHPNDGWFGRSFLSFLLPAKRAMTPGAYLNGVVAAERNSDGTFSGTLDLGKSTPTVFAAPNCLPDNDTVPFTAKLDQEQRLAEIALTLDQARWVTTYSDFGVPAAVQAPPSQDVVEAPLAFYQFFGDTGCII